MRIIPLSEGTFTVDKTKHFLPFDGIKDNLDARPAGSLLVEVQPFVVITAKDVLLLDTGLGFSDENGKMQLHQNLQHAGIDPSSVTKVLLSHLHKDHAGGLGLMNDAGSEEKLSFHNAKDYVQEEELKFAMKKGLPSFVQNKIELLKNSSQTSLLQKNKGAIDEYLYYEVTAAHSPFHQVFWIKENDETVFFGGDDAPQLQQMKHRFVAKYDYDGKRASLLRQQWWNQGEKEKWTFLFYHDVKNSVWKF